MQIVGILIIAASAAILTLSAQVVDLFGHRAGLWSIEPDGSTTRWVEIHNLEEAKTTGIFHVEVLGRRRGDPAWKIQHLAPHLAITTAALQRSVRKPLTRGSVYPETFDAAYSEWCKARDGGGNTPVCSSTVAACIRENRGAGVQMSR